MSLKIITINIFDPTNRSSCIQQITEEDHIKLTDSTYLLHTSKSLDILRREMAEYFDKTDTLFISKVPDKQWISFHFGKHKSWVEENV